MFIILPIGQLTIYVFYDFNGLFYAFYFINCKLCICVPNELELCVHVPADYIFAALTTSGLNWLQLRDGLTYIFYPCKSSQIKSDIVCAVNSGPAPVFQ